MLKGVIRVANQEQLIKIAMNCSQYEPSDNSFTSSTDIEEPSCEYCTHYTSDKRCNLDLIDRILSSMAMELE